MFCPRCGQEQISEDLRFCPGCGLSMGLIFEILNHGGTLPQLMELAKKEKFFTRKKGVFFSLIWFIFMVLIVTPFWAIVDVEEMAALAAVTGIFGSLLILLFSIFFLPSAKSVTDGAFAHLDSPQRAGNLTGADGRQNALPPKQTQNAEDYISPQSAGNWRAPDTDDLVRPGSVTEQTTKLLRKEEDQ